MTGVSPDRQFSSPSGRGWRQGSGARRRGGPARASASYERLGEQRLGHHTLVGASTGGLSAATGLAAGPPTAQPRPDPSSMDTAGSGGPVTLFDTHAHLHFPDFADDLDAVLARARTAGVCGMVTIGTDVETSRAALDLAGRHPDVYAAVGVHPHDAGAADETALGEIERLARSSGRVVAIGEMGLDFFRNLSPRDAQERVFRWQLELCRRVGKPALIHCREAHAETLAICAAERVAEIGGIMHCFSGDAAIARRCLDLGLLISLAGPVTYPNARKLPEVVRLAPADRLVVETDCPFLPPQPYRGKRNEPAHIAITAARVAELRDEPLAWLAERTTANARALLRLP